MDSLPNLVRSLTTRLAARLRFPYLFLLTLTLFLLDVVIPDFIPLADEIILGLSTLLFATWRNSKQQEGTGPDPAEIKGS